MKDFVSRHWFTLLIAAFAGLAAVNNLFPPPEPVRNQPDWPPPPRRASMMTGPCTEWRSTIVTGAVPEPGKPFADALAGQFEKAAIIGENDPAAGGKMSREATGIGIAVEFVAAGENSKRGVLEATLFDLCRLVLLDHSSTEVADGVSPEGAAAAVRADLDQLLPKSYRAPVVEIGAYATLDGAPALLADRFRDSFRDRAAATDDLLFRETGSEKLRLEGAKKVHNPTLPPDPALKLNIRVGRKAEQYIAYLDRESPVPGSETLEADSIEALTGSVMDRLHRLVMAH